MPDPARSDTVFRYRRITLPESEALSDITLAAVALALAGLPALIYLRNRPLYRPPPAPAGDTTPPRVSLLIPARDEAASIADCLAAALASSGVDLEVVVLDDHSTDATADIVREVARQDPRVRLHPAPELPPGWCGKQHACQSLSRLAGHEILVFVDADVTLAPDGLARMARFLDDSGASLVSGFPRQRTGTITEKMVIPLMHFLLLGFLPIGPMRRFPYPSLGAGCGQLFVTRRDDYDRAGGHAAVRTSLHDGVTLPRAYRKAGLMTDVCDATDVCSCRMYRSAGQLWHGLAKNSREGLGAPGMLFFSTGLLLGGQVMPFVLLACAAWLTTPALGLTIAACLAAYAPRLDAAWRFRQSWLGALLHPAGVTTLVAIQWYANVRKWLGRPVGWKGRPPPSGSGQPNSPPITPP